MLESESLACQCPRAAETRLQGQTAVHMEQGRDAETGGHLLESSLLVTKSIKGRANPRDIG